jgi:hypothetical protein
MISCCSIITALIAACLIAATQGGKRIERRNRNLSDTVRLLGGGLVQIPLMPWMFVSC